MKINIDRDILAEKLVGCKGIATKTSSNITRFLLFDIGQQCSVTATDMENLYVGRFAVTGEGQGRLVLPYDKVLTIVSTAPERDIVLSEYGDQVIFLSGGARYSIYKSYQPEDFPAVILEDVEWVTMDGGLLAGALGHACKVQPGGEHRTHISGALITAEDGVVVFRGTDGARLHVKTIQVDGVTGISALASKKGLLAVMRQMAGATVGVGVTKTYVYFDIGGDIYGVRQYEGLYPDTETLVREARQAPRFQVSRDLIAGTLKRFMSFVPGAVTVDVIGNELKIEAQRAEYGVLFDTIEIENNDSIQINKLIVTPEYLSAAIDPAGDVVGIGYAGEGRAIYVYCDDNTEALIMPRKGE